jgi:ketosteroid isomerase-like protein
MKSISGMLLPVLFCIILGGCASTSRDQPAAPPSGPTAEERLERATRENEKILSAVRALKPEALAEVGLYRIEPGDTGSKIAGKQQLALAELATMNPDVTWTRLRVGQVIRIRPKPSQPPEGADRDRAAIEKAVLETNARMTEAANRLDADAFFAYIIDTDKGPIIQNGVLFKSRQEALETVKRGFQGIATIERQFENPQVTVLSPDAALMTAEGSTTATLTDGRIIHRRFAVSLVFVRREGQWKLLHGHYSMPANPG